jgi:hypothetical protein
VVLSLVRRQLLLAIGYEAPPLWVARMVRGALKARGWLNRYVPMEAYPSGLERTPNRTYPGNRYTIEGLGPEYASRTGDDAGLKRADAAPSCRVSRPT